MSRKHEQEQELTSDQLEQVAGGSHGGEVAMETISFKATGPKQQVKSPQVQNQAVDMTIKF